MKLVNKMRLLVVLLSSLPILIFGFWSFQFSKSFTTQETLKHVNEQAILEAKLVTSIFELYQHRMNGITSRTQLRLNLKKINNDQTSPKLIQKTERILRDALISSDKIQSIAIYDLQGHPIVHVGQAIDLSRKAVKAIYAKNAKSIDFIDVEGLPVQIMTKHPLILNYKVLGAIVIVQSTDELRKVLKHESVFESNSQRYITSSQFTSFSNAILLTHTSKPDQKQLIQSECVNKITLSRNTINNPLSFECTDNNNKTRIVSLAPLSDNQFLYIVVHDSNSLQVYMNEMITYIIATLILFIIISFVLSSYLGHVAFLPLQNFIKKLQTFKINQDDPMSLVEGLQNKEILGIAQKLTDALTQLKTTIVTCEEFEAVNIKLEESNLTKDRFVAMATHDLRNPITIMKMNLEMVLNGYFGALSEKQIQAFEKQQKVLKNMLDIVNDLLDVSQFESGNLTLEKQTFSWNDFIQTLYEEHKDLAKYKNVKSELKLLDTDKQITADQSRLMQAIMNYYTNAIKYTLPETTVYLESSCTPKHLIFQVSDHGPGIAQNELNKLFIPFSKTSTRPTGGEKSVGLGLAIVKKIIEAHNGEVFVHSTPGKGSTFGLKLPI